MQAVSRSHLNDWRERVQFEGEKNLLTAPPRPSSCRSSSSSTALSCVRLEEKAKPLLFPIQNRGFNPNRSRPR